MLYTLVVAIQLYAAEMAASEDDRLHAGRTGLTLRYVIKLINADTLVLM